MLRGILHRLAVRFGADDEDADEETEDARFVPSVLDASVRYAHGMSRTGAEREMADIDEKARVLEEHRRDE